MRHFSSLHIVLRQGKSKRETSGRGKKQISVCQNQGPLHAPVSAQRQPATASSHSPVRTVEELRQTTANGPWNVTQCSTRSSARLAFTHTHICDNTQLLQLMKEELKICRKIWKWEFNKKKKSSLQGMFAFVLETHIVRFSGFSFIIHIIFYFIIYSSVIKSFFN